MFEQLESAARRAAPAVTHWALRALSEVTEELTVRQGVAEAPRRNRDAGVMVTVVDRGGFGYAATSDTSETGLAQAFGRARDLAHAVAGHLAFDVDALQAPPPQGRYRGPAERPALRASLGDRIDLLARANAALRIDDRIIDRSAQLNAIEIDQLFLTGDGGRVEQRHAITIANMQATALAGGVTQTRTSDGQYNGFCQQGGLEVLDRAGFAAQAPQVAADAIELALAPQCPSGEMDLLLMPDQMLIQIHESIGHPLELDRILGDERNFAGTSFVTLDMFGRYQYGSELLNVSHDPTRGEQLASFGFDDDGTPAERRLLIERGRLVRPLGGAVSVARARSLGFALDGVATSRSSSWNRAPIDRMSNLNIEPGESPLDEMIAGIELGVMLRTNCSWSIDDSRNKFQFGCEHGRMIRGGRLAEVVRNPGYRGISATFWRSLAMVGNGDTFRVLGTPFCGKGEPSQVIRVGHATPACVFRGVAVFGGDA